MKEYTFDIDLVTSLTVTAASRAQAERLLRELVDGAEANLGAWPSGSPIIVDVTLEHIELVEET